VLVHAPPGALLEAGRAFAAFEHPVLGDSRHGERRANLHFGMRHGLDRSFWHRRSLELELEGTIRRLECDLAPDLNAVLRSLRAT
jgi:hypothetical protein